MTFIEKVWTGIITYIGVLGVNSVLLVLTSGLIRTLILVINVFMVCSILLIAQVFQNGIREGMEESIK